MQVAELKRQSDRGKSAHITHAAVIDCAATLPALIAACTYIAHADGAFDLTERRRIVNLARVLPLCRDALGHDISAAIARWERAFAIAPREARKDALEAVSALRLDEADARQFLAACQHVLEADGVFHTSEYQALRDIGHALASSGTAPASS